MQGEKDLTKLIKELRPKLNPGEYVFVSVKDLQGIDRNDILCEFKENEGITLVLPRQKADDFNLKYEFVASWITLRVHSSLEAVGLTAMFSKTLAEKNISCNVIAGYYHDHIFVSNKDTDMAMHVLGTLADL